MNKAQILALSLLVIAVMVLSTPAFVWISSITEGNKQPSTGEQPQQQTQGTRLSYSGETEATVLEIFPSAKLFSETTEADIQVLDAIIAKTPGLTKASSSFKQNPETAGSLFYIVELSFDAKKTSQEKILQEIQENSNGLLHSIYLLPSALVQTPAKIALKNKDLNVMREFSPKNSMLQANIMQETQKGDLVQLSISATFEADKPISLEAFEAQNLSLVEKNHSFASLQEVVSLEPKLLLFGDVNLSTGATAAAIETEFKKLSGYKSSSVSLSMPFASMVVAIDSNAWMPREQDLNALLSASSEVTGSNFRATDQNFLRLRIDLNEAITASAFVSLKEKIVAALKQYGIAEKDSTIAEPFLDLGENDFVEFSSTELSQQFAAIKEILRARQFNDFKVYQLGSIAPKTLFAQDENKNYSFDSNSLEILLKPSPSIGQSVLANIDFTTKRNQVVFARAIEAASLTGLSG